MVVSRSNGHLNGYHENGGQGDTATTELEHGRGDTMRLMQRMVGLGHTLMDEQIKQIVNMAVGIRDHAEASARDRLRAGELLAALIARGVDVAMYLDKNNRIDDGKLTELVGHRNYAVAFDDRT